MVLPAVTTRGAILSFEVMVKRGKGIGIYVYSIGYLIVKMKM
jgi:hypothetical protein